MKIVIVSDTNPYLPLPSAKYTLIDLARTLAQADHRVSLVAPNHTRTVRNFQNCHLITYTSITGVSSAATETVTNLRFIAQQSQAIEADVIITANHTIYSLVLQWQLRAPVILQSALSARSESYFDLSHFFARSMKRIIPDRRKLLVFTDFYSTAEIERLNNLMTDLDSSVNLLCIWWTKQGKANADQLVATLPDRTNIIAQPLREQLADIYKHCGALLHSSGQQLPLAYYVYAAAAGIPIVAPKFRSSTKLGDGYFPIKLGEAATSQVVITKLVELGKHKYHNLRTQLKASAGQFDAKSQLDQLILRITRILHTRKTFPTKASVIQRLPHWLTTR